MAILGFLIVSPALVHFIGWGRGGKLRRSDPQLKTAQLGAEAAAQRAMILAATDQLNGKANRRHFRDQFEVELQAVEAASSAQAFILPDIDHFKEINDTHGHPFGNEVLKAVADAADNCLRSKDLFGRFGGEEFAVLLPGVGIEAAGVLAERIRVAVNRWSFAPELVGYISISLGVSTDEPAADSTWLIQAADVALYEAKTSGRNCIRIAA